ncbi:MAG: bifunctional oligoribonuclease/PAP phosphatase NrnA [Micromonosporaceae bacterium]|nr:bifunctional oligoribonuclease/PAP phosphatase NrnA [Micromonosporaceae bacterium]
MDGDGQPAISEESWRQAVAAISDAERPLLVCHVNPDGDALGSMLGCALALRRLGRPAQAAFPGPQELPEMFAWLPGIDLLTAPEDTDREPDVMLTFDAASVGRLGEFADRMAGAKHVVVLDHHASNPGFGTVNLVDPHAAATGLVVDELVRRLGVPLDREIAECLYVALATDTGSFKYQATTPKVHQFAARLLQAGVDHYEISRRLFDARPLGALRIFGEALGRLCLEPEAADGAGFVWTYATLDDLARHDQPAHVLESLIDVVRSVEEADVACVAKQLADEEWAVSLRSRGAVNVAAAAAALGGGGHRYAAGFTGEGDLTRVIDALRATLGDHATSA